MVQPKRNMSAKVALSLTAVSPLVEAQKKIVKSCRETQTKCVEAPIVAAPAIEQTQIVVGRKPWGRSKSFDEPTERIPIALPATIAQSLRLKAVMIKRTPSQIIAELLRTYLCQ
jgi:hypothetical protein